MLGLPLYSYAITPFTIRGHQTSETHPRKFAPLQYDFIIEIEVCRLNYLVTFTPVFL